MEADAFVHAALEEERVGIGALAVLRMRLDPLQELMDRMGHRMDRRVRAGHQVERHLLHQDVVRCMQLVVALEHREQHVAWQIGLFGISPLACAASNSVRRRFDGVKNCGIELVETALDFGADCGAIAERLPEGCCLAERPQQGSAILSVSAVGSRGPVDAGKIRGQVQHDAVPEFHDIRLARSDVGRERLRKRGPEHVLLVVNGRTPGAESW